ncbi:unnamed protein product [Acanthoscelides obtectus]|uniref:Uncharacterized protein n=1 Tax=Acanthoscelides obtectus TaxID=200917 RepID=A0A9P0PV72_ACAOB|nr:unnamed protein product [Acanthoscelides obtectus]CAK1678406.1 hypothetical protein AOBTE_LOCUS31876 [Acanthoscelides obtectus]
MLNIYPLMEQLYTVTPVQSKLFHLTDVKGFPGSACSYCCIPVFWHVLDAIFCPLDTTIENQSGLSHTCSILPHNGYSFPLTYKNRLVPSVCKTKRYIFQNSPRQRFIHPEQYTHRTLISENLDLDHPGFQRLICVLKPEISDRSTPCYSHSQGNEETI